MSKHTSPIHLALFLMTACVGLVACDAETSDTDQLRAALDDAEFDLGEAVLKAEAAVPEDPAQAAEEAQSLGGHANLLRGIAIAEARSGGEAFKIEVEDGLIKITVLAGDEVRVIVIEPGTGVVLENKPADEGDEGDEGDAEEEDEPADE